MSAENNLYKIDVKKSTLADIQQHLKHFEVNKREEVVKFCKHNSKESFKNKNTINGSNKLGKTIIITN